MLNTGYRKHCKDITVRQPRECLKKNVPQDVLPCVCGNSGSVFSADGTAMSGIPEYEGCETGRVAKRDGGKKNWT